MSPRPVTFHAPSVVTAPGYSHAARAGGLLFVSGQIALDEQGAVVGVDDMAAQARQVFRNLGAVLAAAGAGFADLVKLTIYVTDVGAVAAVRAARDEVVDPAAPPASTLVEVARLVHPDLLVEVEAVAVAPDA
jgi:reactive intermediate/imine deaminase